MAERKWVTKIPKKMKPESTIKDKPTPGIVVGRETKRQTQIEVWEDILDTFGDPLMELAKIAYDPNISLRDKKDCLKELVQYGHSKRRSVEITGADGAPLEVRLQLIDSIAQNFASKLKK
jgi:predicted transcriptional regulator